MEPSGVDDELDVGDSDDVAIEQPAEIVEAECEANAAATDDTIAAAGDVAATVAVIECVTTTTTLEEASAATASSNAEEDAARITAMEDALATTTDVPASADVLSESIAASAATIAQEIISGESLVAELAIASPPTTDEERCEVAATVGDDEGLVEYNKVDVESDASPRATEECEHAFSERPSCSPTANIDVPHLTNEAIVDLDVLDDLPSTPMIAIVSTTSEATQLQESCGTNPAMPFVKTSAEADVQTASNEEQCGMATEIMNNLSTAAGSEDPNSAELATATGADDIFTDDIAAQSMTEQPQDATHELPALPPPPVTAPIAAAAVVPKYVPLNLPPRVLRGPSVRSDSLPDIFASPAARAAASRPVRIKRMVAPLQPQVTPRPSPPQNSNAAAVVGKTASASTTVVSTSKPTASAAPASLAKNTTVQPTSTANRSAITTTTKANDSSASKVNDWVERRQKLNRAVDGFADVPHFLTHKTLDPLELRVAVAMSAAAEAAQVKEKLAASSTPSSRRATASRERAASRGSRVQRRATATAKQSITISNSGSSKDKDSSRSSRRMTSNTHANSNQQPPHSATAILVSEGGEGECGPATAPAEEAANTNTTSIHSQISSSRLASPLQPGRSRSVSFAAASSRNALISPSSAAAQKSLESTWVGEQAEDDGSTTNSPTANCKSINDHPHLSSATFTPASNRTSISSTAHKSKPSTPSSSTSRLSSPTKKENAMKENVKKSSTTLTLAQAGEVLKRFCAENRWQLYQLVSRHLAVEANGWIPIGQCVHLLQQAGSLMPATSDILSLAQHPFTGSLAPLSSIQLTRLLEASGITRDGLVDSKAIFDGQWQQTKRIKRFALQKDDAELQRSHQRLARDIAASAAARQASHRMHVEPIIKSDLRKVTLPRAWPVTAQAALHKLDPWAMAVQQDVPCNRTASASASTSRAVSSLSKRTASATTSEVNDTDTPHATDRELLSGSLASSLTASPSRAPTNPRTSAASGKNSAKPGQHAIKSAGHKAASSTILITSTSFVTPSSSVSSTVAKPTILAALPTRAATATAATSVTTSAKAKSKPVSKSANPKLASSTCTSTRTCEPSAPRQPLRSATHRQQAQQADELRTVAAMLHTAGIDVPLVSLRDALLCECEDDLIHSHAHAHHGTSTATTAALPLAGAF